MNEYKRDLIRLEDALSKVVPRIKEANQLATTLGRCVKFEAVLVTSIQESKVDAPLSPVEELLTQKLTHLYVRAVLHNPRSDMRRDWFWEPEVFFDRIGKMREVWMKWMLEQVMCDLHTKGDPFWTPPEQQLVGTAYLYLAPLAYRCAQAIWVPIHNFAGKREGELRVALTPTEADLKTPLKPTDNPAAMLDKPLNFTLLIEQARGLMDCANKDVRIFYTFSDEEGKRSTPPCKGKKFDPKFNETFNFQVMNCGEKMVEYLNKDAICFEVWAEAEEVPEGDVAEAISMELPPETFEFFLSHDVRKASDGAPCTFEEKVGPKNKPGHLVPQDSAHSLVFAVAQADKNFRVCNVSRPSIGHICDAATGKPVSNDWTSLHISKQQRAKDNEPWVVEIDWPTLPKVLQAPEAVGKVFTIDLKCEISEVERLGLEEPLGLLKTFTIQVAASGTGYAAALDLDETKKRYLLTASVMEIYMGSFEVSDAAVNAAMTQMRDADVGGGKSSKEIMSELADHVHLLQQQMVEDESTQNTDLGIKMQTLGYDVTAQLELSQLPSEFLQGGGAGAGSSNDVGELKKEIANLKLELAAAKDRIKYLEGASGAVNAAKQINDLRTL